jgi:hypothetical protein
MAMMVAQPDGKDDLDQQQDCDLGEHQQQPHKKCVADANRLARRTSDSSYSQKTRKSVSISLVVPYNSAEPLVL